MEKSVEKSWTDLYLSNAEMIGEGFPSSVNALRAEALESFNLLGAPRKGSGRGDRYHYTDLSRMLGEEYEHYFTPSYPSFRFGEEAPEEESYGIGLLNGFFRGDEPLVRLGNGAVFGSLAAAAAEFPDLFGQYYNRLADTQHDAVAALNTVFAQDGAFVFVPRGAEIDRPIRVTCAYAGEGEAVAGFVRCLFVLEENASARIVLDCRTFSDERFLGCHMREVYAGPGARLDLVELCRMNGRSSLISGCGLEQRRNSSVSSLTVAAGGRLVRGERNVYLVEPGAENRTSGLTVAGAGEHFDFMTDIAHRAADCTSRQHFKGIAADGGTAVFSGRIFVARDAQRTEAYQQSNNLLLGEQAHIYAKPQLEIYADDVKCSHGATVGQLDADAVYYMRQRGIAQEDARRLQMYGFVNDIVEKTDIGMLKPVIGSLVSEKIDRL